VPASSLSTFDHKKKIIKFKNSSKETNIHRQNLKVHHNSKKAEIIFKDKIHQKEYQKFQSFW